MKVLVTGANGMLGSALCPLLIKNGNVVIATDIKFDDDFVGGEFLDIREFEKVRKAIRKHSPDIVYHLAAETDVDKCETEIDHAFITNFVGTENIALACLEMNVTMVYISTCSVFDGKKCEPYNEFDLPNPINVYAKSKYEGERVVTHLLSRYFIFRAGWMIGGGRKDKKFVAKINELLKTNKILTVVNDKRGSPTFTKDFSRGILRLIDSGRYGLYHVTNDGIATRYDIACKIVDYAGKKDVVVRPISSDAFPLPAPRPNSEASDNYKMKLLGLRMPVWEETLKDYLSELD